MFNYPAGTLMFDHVDAESQFNDLLGVYLSRCADVLTRNPPKPDLNSMMVVFQVIKVCQHCFFLKHTYTHVYLNLCAILLRTGTACMTPVKRGKGCNELENFFTVKSLDYVSQKGRRGGLKIVNYLYREQTE